MWNRKEALFLSSFSIVFTSDLECFALLSSVGCIGTLMVSVVSGRTRLPSNLLRLPGSSSGASRSRSLSRVTIRVETMSYVGSWTAPKTTTCGCFEHSTCGCLVRET